MNFFRTLHTSFLAAGLLTIGALGGAAAQAAPAATSAAGATAGATSAPASSADTDATISPDRPDFTDGPMIVPVGHVQLEAGATAARSGGSRANSFGELLVRVPASKRLEVRVGVPSYLRQRGGGVSASGLDDASVEAKLQLSPGGNGRPATALLLGSALPTGSRRVAEHRYQPQLKASAEWDFCPEVSLGVNLGYGRPTDGGQRFSQIFASASLGLQMSEKVGAFIEAYGFNHGDATGASAKYADTGLSYLVNPKLSLDARVGFGLNNHAGGPDYFYGAGASRLF